MINLATLLPKREIHPDRLLLHRLQAMTNDEFMDWVFSDGYKGIAPGLRAYAAVKWCKIRWPNDAPDDHRAEAEAIFCAHDAMQPWERRR